MFVVSYSSEELSAHAIHPRLRGGQQTFHKAKMAASGCGCQQSVWVTGEPLQRKSLEEEGEREGGREGASREDGREEEGGREGGGGRDAMLRIIDSWIFIFVNGESVSDQKHYNKFSQPLLLYTTTVPIL